MYVFVGVVILYGCGYLIRRLAHEEPGSSEPFINGPWNIHKLPQSAFIMLMSDGLYETYSVCINSKNTHVVHEGLAKIVSEEMTLHRRLDRVATTTINRVKEQYRQQFMEGIHVMDDITLVIYNLSYAVDSNVPSYVPSYIRPNSGPANTGGEFVPEGVDHPAGWHPHSGDVVTLARTKPSRDTVEDLSSRLNESMTIGRHQPSQPTHPPSPPPEPVALATPKLTEDQIASGKYIAPYVTFPVDFPHDLDLERL